MLIFIGQCVFQSGCTFLFPTSSVWEYQLVCYLHQHLVFSTSIYLFSSISHFRVCVLVSHDLDPFLLRIYISFNLGNFSCFLLIISLAISPFLSSLLLLPWILLVWCWTHWVVSHIFSQILLCFLSSNFCAISLALFQPMYIIFSFNFVCHFF